MEYGQRNIKGEHFNLFLNYICKLELIYFLVDLLSKLLDNNINHILESYLTV